MWKNFYVCGITKWTYLWGAYLRGAYMSTSLNVSSGIGLSVGVGLSPGKGLSPEFYGIHFCV